MEGQGDLVALILTSFASVIQHSLRAVGRTMLALYNLLMKHTLLRIIQEIQANKYRKLGMQDHYCDYLN